MQHSTQEAPAARSAERRATQFLLLTLLATCLLTGCVRTHGSRVHVSECEITEAADTGYHLVAAFFHIASALSGD